MSLTRSTPESTRLAGKLNWLRAGVLGANDGIVSIAGLLMGFAGAQANSRAILVAGLAGLVSGALSMAGGEYVSVSTQADTEKAALDAQARQLSLHPDEELRILAGSYQDRGLSPLLAQQVADELTQHDALTAHAETRLGIHPGELTNPWAAAASSFVAFAIGALIPLVLMVLSPVSLRVGATVVGVELALALTGYTSARLGGAASGRAIIRNMFVATAAMAATYLIGALLAG